VSTLGPTIAKRLMQFFAGLSPGAACVLPEPTEREQGVLAAVDTACNPDRSNLRDHVGHYRRGSQLAS